MLRLFAMRWFMEEYFKGHSANNSKPLEISHGQAPHLINSLFEWLMAATLSLDSDVDVAVGKI